MNAAWVLTLFALYGVYALADRLYRWHLSRRRRHEGPITIVLAVGDAESFIEVLLREAIFLCGDLRNAHIVVITKSCTDATRDIIEKLQEQYGVLRHHAVDTVEELFPCLNMSFPASVEATFFFDVDNAASAKRALTWLRRLSPDYLK